MGGGKVISKAQTKMTNWEKIFTTFTKYTKGHFLNF